MFHPVEAVVVVGMVNAAEALRDDLSRLIVNGGGQAVGRQARRDRLGDAGQFELGEVAVNCGMVTGRLNADCDW